MAAHGSHVKTVRRDNSGEPKPVPLSTILRLVGAGNNRSVFVYQNVRYGGPHEPPRDKQVYCTKVEQLTGYNSLVKDTESFTENMLWIKMNQPIWYGSDKMKAFRAKLNIAESFQHVDSEKSPQEIAQSRPDIIVQNTGDNQVVRCVWNSTLLCPMKALYFALYQGTYGLVVALVTETTEVEVFQDDAALIKYRGDLDDSERQDFDARLYAITYAIRGLVALFMVLCLVTELPE